MKNVYFQIIGFIIPLLLISIISYTRDKLILYLTTLFVYSLILLCFYKEFMPTLGPGGITLIFIDTIYKNKEPIAFWIFFIIYTSLVMFITYDVFYTQ